MSGYKVEKLKLAKVNIYSISQIRLIIEKELASLTNIITHPTIVKIFENSS